MLTNAFLRAARRAIAIAPLLLGFAVAQTPSTELHLIPQSGPGIEPQFVALSPKADFAVTSAYKGGDLCLWRVSDGSMIWRSHNPGLLRRLEFAPDASRILAVFEPEATLFNGLVGLDGRQRPRNEALLFDIASATPRVRIKGPANGSEWIQFVGLDGRLLLGGFEDGPHLIPLGVTGKDEVPSSNGGWGAVAVDTKFSKVAFAMATNEIMILDTTTKMSHKLPQADSPIAVLKFSNDGNLLAAGDESGRVRVWDTHSSQMRREWSIPGGDCPRVETACNAAYKLSFAPSGESILAATIGGKASLWSISDGGLRAVCDPPKWAMNTVSVFGGPKVLNVTFDPLGKFYVVQSSKAVMWDAKTNQIVNPFEKQLLASTPELAQMPISRLEANRASDFGWYFPIAVAFANQGSQTMAVFDTFAHPPGVMVWRDRQDALPIAELRKQIDDSENAVPSPNGKLLASAHNNSVVELWDLRKGQIVQSLQIPGGIDRIMFSPDSSSLLVSTGLRPNKLFLWRIDADTTASIPVPLTKGDHLADASFSYEGDSIFTLSRLGFLVKWSLDGSAHSTITKLDKVDSSAHLAPVNAGLIAVESDNKVRVVNQADGAIVRHYGEGDAEETPLSEEALLSLDGRFVLTWPGEEGKYYSLINLVTGAERARWPRSSDDVGGPTIMVFQTNGRDSVATQFGDVITIRDLERQTEVASVAINYPHLGGYLAEANVLVAGTLQNGINFVDVATGALRAQLFEKRLSTNEDALDKSKEPKVGAPGRFLVVDQNGRFDTNSYEVEPAVRWVVSDDPLNPLPVDIFRRDYYLPKLLARLLTNPGPPAVRLISTLNRTQPRVRVVGVQKESPGYVTVSVTVVSQAFKLQKEVGPSIESGAYDLHLYRDGQLVYEYPNLPSGAEVYSETAGTKPDYEQWRAPHRILEAGEKTIEIPHVRVPQRGGVDQVIFTAYAFNSDRVKSETSPPFIYKLSQGPSAAERRAYLITVGVNANESQDPWRLELSVSSAERARAILREELKADFKDIVEVPLYADFAPDSPQAVVTKARKAYLQSLFKVLAGRDRDVDSGILSNIGPDHKLRAATPDDAVVFYVASHGYADPEGNFYLIPYDTGAHRGLTEDELDRCGHPGGSGHGNCQNVQDFLKRAISSNDLAEWWRDIDAGEMVMIIDSCHSGSVPGTAFRPGPLGDRSFGQLGYEKGLSILAATQPAQTAKGDWIGDGEGQTLLIQALVQVGRSNAQLGLVELLQGAARRVPAIAHIRYPELNDNELQAPELLDFGTELSIRRGASLGTAKKEKIQQPLFLNREIVGDVARSLRSDNEGENR